MGNHNYIIKVYIMGEVVQELHPKSYKEAQQDYFRTSYQSTCYTELYVDGERYNTVQAEKFLDPTRVFRRAQRNNSYEFMSDLYDHYGLGSK